MKILVIGASRGIGLELVRQALGRGHEVTAMSRDISKLTLNHPQLLKIECDIGDAACVASATAGKDAVCSCIGTWMTRQRADIFSRGARNVLEAIAGTRTKYIAVTGVGAGDSRGHGGFFYDKILQPLLLREMYDDKDREEALIRASDADWLIVRPGRLTNGPRTGHYRAVTDMNGFVVGSISRADVADFMLEQLERPTYFGQTPALTY